ncbi:unnamed protein product [Clonostachys chloroleuca]|uniref:Uncharacterized protein n=1 Tax=Clonostachys chloroleuca TaxID=1926264 RepID=A0AA35V9U5_9HYPO|nr:unnamed protein product [Clonostachys chloroleuca]
MDPPDATPQGRASSQTHESQLLQCIKPLRKRRCRRIIQPSKNSLYDLMHEHAGTSLFVRPIFWTSIHLDVLGVRFAELPVCDLRLPEDIPGSPPSKGHMRPSQKIRTLSNALTDILLPGTQHPVLSSNAIRTIMHTLWPGSFKESKLMPELHLYVGGRIYRDSVRAQVMWNFPSELPGTSQNSFESISTVPAESFGIISPSSSNPHNPTDLPMMCYIGKNHIATIRKNLFRIVPGPQNAPNGPVQRLQQLRSKMLMPANPDQDPHLVGIFLAMAQRHFYGLPTTHGRRFSPWRPPKEISTRPNFRDLKLRILTHDIETSEFIIYTAVVTAQFLDRFHNPFRVPAGSDESELPQMDISYTRVPIWPILGLRERFGKALGQDVVGYFSPDKVETWEVDPEPTEPTASVEPTAAVKRKHESLNDVLNVNYEGETSESEADEPALSAKKRCLSEGSPIGVVV